MTTPSRISLLYKGYEDEITYGSPSVSYFRTVYPRYTRFSKHIVDISAGDGKINFGKTTRIEIPRSGDFIKNIFFRFEFPKVDIYPGLVITRGVGFLIFDYVDLYIGGQLIDRLTGDFMFQHTWLTSSPNEIQALTSMAYIQYDIAGETSYTNPYTSNFPLTMYVPFPFYFYKHVSHAIPACALYKQKIEIQFKLKKLSQLVRFGGSYPPYYIDPAIIDDLSLYSLGICTVPVEYVYVDDDFRNRLLKSELSYTITQTQLTKFIENPTVTERTLTMNWVNPVKDLFFFVSDAIALGPYFLPVSGTQHLGNSRHSGLNLSRNDPNTYGLSLYRHLDEIELRFNNELVLKQNYQYFQNYVPAFYYTNGRAFMRRSYDGPYITDGFGFQNELDSTYMHVYSFAQKPESSQPTGQVNMSRILDKKLTLRYFPTSLYRYVRVYARNYNILKIRDGLGGLMFTHNSDYDYDLNVKEIIDPMYY